MLIRRYSVLDLDEVWRIHLLALGEAGVEPTNAHYDDIKNIDLLYLERGGEFLVGAVDDYVVAMGGLKRTSANKAEIKRMRVHPLHQRRGYGEAILRELERRAAELGFATLHLDTLVTQVGAQKLYAKHGYRETGRESIDGFDCVLFEKSLV